MSDRHERIEEAFARVEEGAGARSFPGRGRPLVALPFDTRSKPSPERSMRGRIWKRVQRCGPSASRGGER